MRWAILRLTSSHCSFLYWNKVSLWTIKLSYYCFLISLIIVHGFPAAMQFAGISLVTMLFIPIIVFSPIVTPFITITPYPNHTLSCIFIGLGEGVRGSSKWKSPSAITQLAPTRTLFPISILLNAVMEHPLNPHCFPICKEADGIMVVRMQLWLIPIWLVYRLELKMQLLPILISELLHLNTEVHPLYWHPFPDFTPMLRKYNVSNVLVVLNKVLWNVLLTSLIILFIKSVNGIISFYWIIF